MRPDEIEEQVNILMSRTQCEAIDKHMRWLFVLLDAGVPEPEAHGIIASVAREREAA